MSDLLLMASSPLRSLLSIPGTVALYDPYRDVYGRNTFPVGSENFQTGWSKGSNLEVTVTGPDSDGWYSLTIINSDLSSNRFYRTFVGGVAGSAQINFGLEIQVISGESWWGRVGKQYPLTAELYGSPTTAIWTTSDTEPSGYAGFYTDSQTSFQAKVRRPRRFLSSTLPPYATPVGLSQVLTDFRGTGNHAQLGSTSGADTNDPSWSHVSNYFDGVDDVYSNWPDAEYELHAWGSAINSFGWVSAVPTETLGHYFGGILLNRTPGEGEEARIKGAMRALLASRGVTLA